MSIADCLKLLNITGAPTKAAVKKAFRQAALTHHPDKRGSSTAFQKVKKAYDTLMVLPEEDLLRHKAHAAPARAETPRNNRGYDPFVDPEYDEHIFFTPENLHTEGFERSTRAKGCPHCDGRGFMTKITDPSRGYASKERRLCKCQWL